MMRALLVVAALVVLLSPHVSAGTTLENKGLSSRPPAPNCPFSPARWDSHSREWSCPSTCSDGSHPNCVAEPCATARCIGGTVCVNNYCSHYPVTTSGKCAASCVTPVNCFKDPCQVEKGQPKRCPTGKVCQADYRFGCGFTCEPEPEPTTAAPTLPPVPRPQCPFADAVWNSSTRQWECPSTCSDGSQPNCFARPCAVTLCASGKVCIDNYCPNYPVPENEKCTAKCVTPVNCIKDPCQVAKGQPSLCPTGQVCQADYSFGCNFTCKPAA